MVSLRVMDYVTLFINLFQTIKMEKFYTNLEMFEIKINIKNKLKV
jgi:hypothetical protein